LQGFFSPLVSNSDPFKLTFGKVYAHSPSNAFVNRLEPKPPQQMPRTKLTPEHLHPVASDEEKLKMDNHRICDPKTLP
jgi:hypothetical protein